MEMRPRASRAFARALAAGLCASGCLATAAPLSAAPVPAAVLRHVTIPVGPLIVRPLAGPYGVWAVTGYVTTYADVLQRIDPATNQPVGPIITTPPRTRDVALGPDELWADAYTDDHYDQRELIRLDPASGAPIAAPQPVGADTPLDGGRLSLTACPALLMHRYDMQCSDTSWQADPPESSSPRAVWALVGTHDFHDPGFALRLDPATGAATLVAPAGDGYTVAVDRTGAAWIGGYGGSVRITPSGRRTGIPTSVTGQYAAIGVDAHAAWAVGDFAHGVHHRIVITKRLQRLDLATGKPVGKPLVLGSVVRDRQGVVAFNWIQVSGGSAWISGPKPGTLTRVYLPRR